MSAMTEIAPPSVRWDLSVLFSGLDDPRIDKWWETIDKRADEFAKAYRGKIDTADLDPKILGAALKEIENIAQEAAKPITFGHLLFAANASDPKIGAFVQKQNEMSTAISVKLMFFDLELMAAPEDAVQKALKDPGLRNYTHYIKVVRMYSAHRLSEAEEVILEETANTG